MRLPHVSSNAATVAPPSTFVGSIVNFATFSFAGTLFEYSTANNAAAIPCSKITFLNALVAGLSLGSRSNSVLSGSSGETTVKIQIKGKGRKIITNFLTTNVFIKF